MILPSALYPLENLDSCFTKIRLNVFKCHKSPGLLTLKAHRMTATFRSFALSSIWHFAIQQLLGSEIRKEDFLKLFLANLKQILRKSRRKELFRKFSDSR